MKLAHWGIVLLLVWMTTISFGLSFMHHHLEVVQASSCGSCSIEQIVLRNRLGYLLGFSSIVFLVTLIVSLRQYVRVVKQPRELV